MIRGRILRAPFLTPARAALVAFAPLWIVACGSSGEDAVIDTTGPCTGARLPDGQYYVQSGLCVRAVANQQGGLRQIVVRTER